MMEQVLVSRQPIYCRDMTVFGYELLFRDSEKDHASFSDGSQATAQVIVNALMDIGLNEIVERHWAFINFERIFLMGDYCESLPSDRVVLEILESVTPDTEVIKRLEELRGKGYRIAIDDFVCQEDYHSLLQLADFVRVDVSGNDWPAIERKLSFLAKHHAKVIAGKVETPEQVKRCKAAGFTYFQGYFFCRPHNVTVKQLPANRLPALHLLSLLNKPDILINELEAAISQDVSLSYKLLRYINSAMCGLNRQVESIRHAAILVGFEKLRGWASLMVLSGFQTNQEIVTTGIVRARMCELLAIELDRPKPERYFLAGLLSVLDAILDRPMGQIVSLLPLSPEFDSALLHQQGEIGEVLRCVLTYERRQWAEAKTYVRLHPRTIDRTYGEAVVWSNSVVGAVNPAIGAST